MTIFIRTILELLVMFSLIAGIFKLHDDWSFIEPPRWRFIIASALGIVFANAIALLFLLTTKASVTWGTWALIVSYAIFTGTLFAARLRITYQTLRSF